MTGTAPYIDTPSLPGDSDGSGNVTLTFPTIPSQRSWQGKVSVPTSNAIASWLVVVNGKTVTQLNGTNGYSFAASAGDQIKLVGTNTSPNTEFQGVLHGQYLPGPVSPLTQPQSPPNSIQAFVQGTGDFGAIPIITSGEADYLGSVTEVGPGAGVALELPAPTPALRDYLCLLIGVTGASAMVAPCFPAGVSLIPGPVHGWPPYVSRARMVNYAQPLGGAGVNNPNSAPQWVPLAVPISEGETVSVIWVPTFSVTSTIYFFGCTELQDDGVITRRIDGRPEPQGSSSESQVLAAAGNANVIAAPGAGLGIMLYSLSAACNGGATLDVAGTISGNPFVIFSLAAGPDSGGLVWEKGLLLDKNTVLTMTQSGAGSSRANATFDVMP